MTHHSECPLLFKLRGWIIWVRCLCPSSSLSTDLLKKMHLFGTGQRHHHVNSTGDLLVHRGQSPVSSRFFHHSHVLFLVFWHHDSWMCSLYQVKLWRLSTIISSTLCVEIILCTTAPILWWVSVAVIVCVLQTSEFNLYRPLLLFDCLQKTVSVALHSIVVQRIEVPKVYHVTCRLDGWQFAATRFVRNSPVLHRNLCLCVLLPFYV